MQRSYGKELNSQYCRSNLNYIKIWEPIITEWSKKHNDLLQSNKNNKIGQLGISNDELYDLMIYGYVL